jgi:uncharacterized protein YoxC
MSDMITQNGKTYFLGRPRAYIQIMALGSMSLSVSMLANVKLRMDWDEDEDLEGGKVMDKDTQKAYAVLKPFMKHGGSKGYATTWEFEPSQAEKALDLINKADAVMNNTVPVEEVIAPIKALMHFNTTANEMVEEKLSADVQNKKKELDALSKEIKDLQNKVNDLNAKGKAIHSEISEEVSKARTEVYEEQKSNGMLEAVTGAMGSYNATTSKDLYKSMQEKEVPGILVQRDKPEMDNDEDDDED